MFCCGNKDCGYALVFETLRSQKFVFGVFNTSGTTKYFMSHKIFPQGQVVSRDCQRIRYFLVLRDGSQGPKSRCIYGCSRLVYRSSASNPLCPKTLFQNPHPCGNFQ
nr:hypothetical protein MarQu_420 [Marseillevirus sp.]